MGGCNGGGVSFGKSNSRGSSYTPKSNQFSAGNGRSSKGGYTPKTGVNFGVPKVSMSFSGGGGYKRK